MHSFKLTYVLSDAKSDSDIYESICQVIKELCSKADSNQVNYYDAIKAAYLNKTRRLPREYYLTTIRDYLLDRVIKNENGINKNLEILWKFTYNLVNTESRVRVVNSDPDNLLVSWNGRSRLDTDQSFIKLNQVKTD